MRYTLLAAAVLVSAGGRAGAAPPAGEAGLTTLRERALDGGAGTRLEQRWRGLPVVGGESYVRRDAGGAVRWTSGGALSIPELGVPAFGAAEALLLAGRPDLPAAAHARLVVWAPPGRAPRLAYQLRLGVDLARLAAPELTVDARTGRVLWRENRVLFSDGKAFDNNPSTSPLGLVSLALGDGAQRLIDDDLEVLSCVDHQSCPLFAGTRRVRWCEPEPLAAADAAGDFLYDRPESDGAVDDAFAEVQMYHHASRTLAYFRGLGGGQLGSRPMQAIVNLRVPESNRALCDGASSAVPLIPFENAAYVPHGAFADVWPATDSMVFGQGARIDYAYDGDVVAHELTHAVMSAATPMGLLVLDERGVDGSMWAMHEGFADYFAAALADDPNIAEYVGDELLGHGQALRVLENTRRCPEDLDGEEHDDSEIFSGALWEIRNTMHESRRAAFDRAAWTVVDSLGAFEDFESVAARLVSESAVVLDSASAARVGAVLEERGLLGCNERVEDRALGAPKRRLHLRGAADYAQLGSLPGPLQLRIVLDKSAGEIRVFADSASPDSPSGRPELSVHVKRDAPLRWNVDSLTSDAEVVAPMAPMTRQGRFEARVVGDFQPGTYYVQLANAGSAVLLGGLRIDAPRDEGCAVGGRASPAGLALLALALLLTRRGRRARRAAR